MPGKPYSAAEKAAMAKKPKGSVKAQLRNKIVSLYSKAKKGF